MKRQRNRTGYVWNKEKLRSYRRDYRKRNHERELQRDRERWARLSDEARSKKIEEQRSFMRQKDMKKDKLEISGTVQTSLQREKKLKKDETKEIQQENLLEHKENSEQELLTSQHLLMKSSNHLFKLMKGLVRNDQDTSIQLYDVDRVMASVACAKQITEMAKAAWTIEQVIKNTE